MPIGVPQTAAAREVILLLFNKNQQHGGGVQFSCYCQASKIYNRVEPEKKDIVYYCIVCVREGLKST